jgi:galactokinase/mevalonate kinase-like predicted kinase
VGFEWFQEETLKLESAWLKHGGILLLTLDIFPQSINLWNSSEGRTVDSEKHHGTLNDIKKMAEELGTVVCIAEMHRFGTPMIHVWQDAPLN